MITHRVTQNVARNPVARAIERKRMETYRVQCTAELRALQHGQVDRSLLMGVAEAIAIAAKSIEGWDDPDEIGTVLVEAMEAIKYISGKDFAWELGACDLICEAFDASMQILSGQDPREKLKAWVWAQNIVAAEMAAKGLQ